VVADGSGSHPPLSQRALTPGALLQLVEASRDGIFTFDRDLRITSWNGAMARISGVLADSALERRVLDILPFLDQASLDGSLSQVLDDVTWSSQPQDFFVPDSARGGRFEATFSPLRSDAGMLSGGIVVFRDVTGNEATDVLLSESEHRFQAMADSAPVLLWMAREDALCTFFNESWLVFTGRTLEQERGVRWAEGVYFEDFQRCMDTYIQAFTRREPFEMEYRLRRADGQYRWILDRGIPRLGSDGKFLGYIGSCVDIHDRRLAEEALGRSEARLRSILDTASEGILSLSADGKVDQANIAAQRLFDHVAKEIEGLYLHDLVEQPFPESNTLLQCGEAIGRRKDGSTFPMEVAFDSRADTTGALTVVVRDISERVSLERRILQSREALQMRIGTDLHDGLGQLLTGVALLAKGLESRVPGAEATTVNRLVELINEAIRQVRALARGLSPLHIDSRNLTGVLEAIAAHTRDVWRIGCNAQSHTSRRSATSVERSDFADSNTKTQLYMIATEAIANAVRHGKATSVELDVSDAGNYHVLSVRDNGSGIGEGKSDGIGLQSMRYRARTIGGYLEVFARPEGGTCVRCYWRANT
jgi:PAS domain S-box-containing protein